jgi:hypothetical protein
MLQLTYAKELYKHAAAEAAVAWHSPEFAQKFRL